MLSGEGFDFQCHSNLTRAILPYGLNEFDVHDVLNVFQVTGLNNNEQYLLLVPLDLTYREVRKRYQMLISGLNGTKPGQSLRLSSSLPKSTSCVRCPHAQEETCLPGDGEPVMRC